MTQACRGLTSCGNRCCNFQVHEPEKSHLDMLLCQPRHTVVAHNQRPAQPPAITGNLYGVVLQEDRDKNRQEASAARTTKLPNKPLRRAVRAEDLAVEKNDRRARCAEEVLRLHPGEGLHAEDESEAALTAAVVGDWSTNVSAFLGYHIQKIGGTHEEALSLSTPCAHRNGLGLRLLGI
jgi:hypothetical protein